MTTDPVASTSSYNPYQTNYGTPASQADSRPKPEENPTAATQAAATKPLEPERTQVQSIPAERTDRSISGQGNKIDLTA